MSQTLAPTDIARLLVEDLKVVTQFFTKDLTFLPADKFHARPMGVARPPALFAAEVAAFNQMVTKLIQGQEAQFADPQGLEQWASKFQTSGDIKTDIDASVDGLIAAIERVEDFGKEVMAPWGQPISIYRLITVTIGHMWYHDGQINYLQCLYGDGEFHWMSD